MISMHSKVFTIVFVVELQVLHSFSYSSHRRSLSPVAGMQESKNHVWLFIFIFQDRYGIYLANEKRFDDFSTTAAPVITDMHSESEHNNEEGANPTAGQNATNKVEEKLPGKKL